MGRRDLCVRFTTEKLLNWLLSNLLKSCPRAQFLALTCLRGQCVFYPCLDNDYNTLDVLPLFWVAFLHKGGGWFNNVFPSKFFPLLGPCSTGHSLSKNAPSTHLHMPSIFCKLQLLYKRAPCKEMYKTTLSKTVPQRQNLYKCPIFSPSGVGLQTHPIATLTQSQR